MLTASVLMAAVRRMPREWNWLTTEYPDNYEAKLLHYTLEIGRAHV